MRDLKPVVTADTSVTDPSPFLGMCAVTRMTGLGRSTVHRPVALDKFLSPVRLCVCASVRLSSRAIAWR